MKKLLLVLIIGIVVILTACDKSVLKFSNVIEADQYLRNNIEHMTWQEFQQLLDENHDFQESDYEKLKIIIENNPRTAYEIVENRLYRFNNKGNFLYMIDAVQKDGTILFKKIEIIN